MKQIAFGDSITAGAGASVQANCYVNLLNTMLGLVIDNTGVSTAMAIDECSVLYSKNTVLGDKSTVMFGTNDQAKYNGDVVKKSNFIDCLRAYGIWLACDSKLATPANGVTFTGAWSNGYAWSCYASTVVGDKATFSVTGTTISLGFIRQYSNIGVFKVKIDGVDKGNFNIGGDVRTILGAAYGAMALSFGGLTAGSHAVEISVVSGGTNGQVYFHWFSGTNAKAKVVFGNIPHAIAYTYGGSNANVDAYNTAIANLAIELSGYGLDVSMVNIVGALVPTDMYDNVHPNNSGHQKIANLFYSALTGQPAISYTACNIYQGSDGNIYGGTLGSLIRLN